jgi:hypothetical protein
MARKSARCTTIQEILRKFHIFAPLLVANPLPYVHTPSPRRSPASVATMELPRKTFDSQMDTLPGSHRAIATYGSSDESESSDLEIQALLSSESGKESGKHILYST